MSLAKRYNILVSDAGVDGLVIRLAQNFNHLSIEAGSARVGVGLSLDRLDYPASGKGWGNFERLAGIPGTVGVAIYMNAGAHGVSLGEFVQESMVMDPDGTISRLSSAEHDFAYRSSIFQHKKLIVLETVLAISPQSNRKLMHNIAASREKRRHLPPLPSCGSTFRNPPGVYAGELIEEMGLKGTKIGQAQISPSHANFIVNLGGASAQDVYALINLVQTEAAARGIFLQTDEGLWGKFE